MTRARRGSFCISRLRPHVQLDSSPLIRHLTIHFQQNQCQCNARVRRVSLLPHLLLAISLRSRSAFFFSTSHVRNQSPTEVRTAAPVCPCACQQCTMGPVLSVSCPAHCPAHCPTRLRQETATSCLCCFCCAQRGHVCTSLKGCASPPPPQTSPHPLSLEVFPRLKLPVDELSDRQRFSREYAGKVRKRGSITGSSSSSQLLQTCVVCAPSQ